MFHTISDWIKFDLHIHTDKSNITKSNDYKGTFTIATLREKLSQTGVNLFSLTDHNIVNIEAYQEYYNTCTSDSPKLIVGVELDITFTLENSTESRDYHTLLIFNIDTYDGAKRIYDRLENFYSKKSLLPKNRKLTIEEIVELFHNEDFLFIPHASSSKSIVDAYKEDIETAQRLVMLMTSAFDKVVDAEKIARYNEGFNRLLSEDFSNRQDNAYVDFSDNHNISKYPCKGDGSQTKQHEFFYVKGNKSYESLRLAFIDPSSRLKSESELSKIRSAPPPYISRIQIPELSHVRGSTIQLSPHLNVIIGGRSSGKSLLFSVIGQKIEHISKASPYKYANLLDPERVYIQLSNYSPSKIVQINPNDIIYINQGDIGFQFEKGDLSEFAQAVGVRTQYDSSGSEFKSLAHNLRERIDSLSQKYGLILSEFNLPFTIPATTLRALNSASYVYLVEDISLSDYDKSEQLRTFIEDSATITSNLTRFLGNKISELSNEETEKINEVIKIITAKQELGAILLNQNSTKLSFLGAAVEIIKDANNALSIDARAKTNALRDLNSIINNAQKMFSSALSLKFECDNITSFSPNKISDIPIRDNISIIRESVQERSAIINAINSNLLNPTQDTSELYHNLLKLATRQLQIKNYPGDNSESAFRKKLITVTEDIIKDIEAPKDYLKYGAHSDSRTMSPGLNSEKYINSILSSPGIKVVCIDQPEDNLGNQFVTNELIKQIRDSKFSKQIIFVTHNPSIVVYGDAESIILATNNDDVISYKQIVLEDVESQKLICSVLDGGQYVFDMRSRKYNILKLNGERR